MLASSGLHHKCAYRSFNEHMLFDKHFMKEVIKLLFMCCSHIILFALVHVKPWKKSRCLCNSEMHHLVPRNFFHFMVTSPWWSVTDFLLLECSILHWYEDKKLHADHFWGLPVASVIVTCAFTERCYFVHCKTTQTFHEMFGKIKILQCLPVTTTEKQDLIIVNMVYLQRTIYLNYSK